MFQTLAILCVVGSACGFELGNEQRLPAGLKVGKENPIDLPLTNKSASYQGYIRMNRPRLPAGYCSLQLWCRREDKFRVCIYIDETGNVAGLQDNIPCDDFKPGYDMREQGYTIWTTILDDRIVRYYAFFIFFVSPHAHKRIESKNPSDVLRDSEVYYSTGFDWKLASVATEKEKLDGIYKKQNCIRGLGHLHSFNMTENQECSPSTLSPFSAMFFNDHLVGCKINVIGHFDEKNKDKYKDHYEYTNTDEAKNAVPNGPKCMYDRIAEDRMLSTTIFFTSDPSQISCE